MSAPRTTACGVLTAGRSPARRAGFATVLVLMLLFMMLLMVITYLRVMRANSVVHTDMSANADNVLTGLVQDIAVTIGADGRIAPLGDENPPSTASIHEPYDYPWTNSARSLNAFRLSYPQLVSRQDGMGDPQTDDAWLAPCEPDGATYGTGNWAQVSNLAGSFLVYSNANLSGLPANPATREFVPMDAPAGAAVTNIAGGAYVDYRNVPANDPRLVDTDGDGVGDALWFYPRGNTVNGVRYVAAVRIMDLSGCVNLNTALGESALAAAPGTQSGTPRKGEGPYEIDPTKLLSAYSLATATASKDYRSPSATTAWQFWLASAAQAGADGQTINIGQDNPVSAAKPHRYGLPGSSAGLPKLSDEAQIRDFSDTLANGTAKNAPTLTPAPLLFNTPANAQSGYAGTAGHYGAMPSRDVRSRTTTISGGSDKVAYPPFVSFAFGIKRPGDLSLYQTDSAGTKNPPGFNNPATVGGDWPWFFWHGPTPVLQTVFGGPDSTSNAGMYPFPEGFKTLVSTSSERPLQYQIQMGVCLQDAMQRDNKPTLGWSWMGWKPLPILTEFYAQMPYVCAGWNWNMPATQATAGGAAVLLQKNTLLSDVTPMIGAIIKQGAWIQQAEPYFWDTATNTFQLQEFDGGNTHAVGCTLTQVGSDIYIQNRYSKYMAGDRRGQNFDSLAGTTNYDAQPLFAGAAQAADNTWSAIYFNTQQNRDSTVNSGRVNPGYNDFRHGLAAGMGSYAFELANPYSIPIRLANIRFTFRSHSQFRDYQDVGNPIMGSYPMGRSADLSTFITAASGLAKDAEDYYVLKPGEKVVFYRNGIENTNRPKASTDDNANRGALRPNAAAWGRPFGGPVVDASGNVDLMATLFPSGLPANTYAVNLGTSTTAPDINGQPSTWDVGLFELQVRAKSADGSMDSNWWAYNRTSYRTLGSGWDVNNCFMCESNIPNGRQAAPGSLVYQQVDVRTFGAAEKLNLLQARPPMYWYDLNRMPVDWGDWEFRTNMLGAVGSQVLGSASPGNGINPYPTQGALPTTSWSPGHPNASGTMPLSPTWMQFSNITAFGQDNKVAFSTQTKFPSGNSGTDKDTAMAGATYTNYSSLPGGRQSIKDGDLFFNYVGIPGDSNHPGTFPELAGAIGTPWTSASVLSRDNAVANAANGPQRHDGTPHAMDIGRIMFAGPIYYSREAGTGNSSYRGLTGGSWGSVPSQGDQLVGMAWQNTIGDAINFHLVKDTKNLGLKGLCLRTDMPFYDGTKVANALLANQTLDQLYAALPANVGSPANTALLRAGIRGLMCGTLSWADAVEGLFCVDSMKYKGSADKGQNVGEFKPGTINLNTAPQAVLNCLSFPTTVGNPAVAFPAANTFTAGILKARGDGAAPAGPLVPNGTGGTTLALRKGLVRVSELQNQDPSWFGVGSSSALFDAVSWLPQQASCRSDIFAAHVLLQGYKQDDFNLGPVDVSRTILILSRDTTGSPAKVIAQYTLPNN